MQVKSVGRQLLTPRSGVSDSVTPQMHPQALVRANHSIVSDSDPVDCSPPGSSGHGILQVRILEWGAISSSRGSSQPRDQTQVSALQVDSLPSEPPGKPIEQINNQTSNSPVGENKLQGKRT